MEIAGGTVMVTKVDSVLVTQRAEVIGKLLAYHHQWRALLEDYNTETLTVKDVDYNFYDMLRNVEKLDGDQRIAIELLILGPEDKEVKKLDLKPLAEILEDRRTALELLAAWQIKEEQDND